MLKESFNLKIVKWLIFASFFTPLIVVDYFFFPFIVPKTIFFQIVVEVALFFYIALVLSNRSYLPKFDVLSKSVLVFFGIYVLAALFGENVFRSFFGVFERMLGVFNLAHFIAFFFIMRGAFKDKKDWVQLFRVFLLAGSAVALYGFAQKLGFSFVYNTGTNRVDATIGNAAFFAAYMMFNAFFAIFMILYDKSNKYFSNFYKFAFVVSILAMYISETRGAILGAFAAFLFLGASLLWNNKSKIRSSGFSLKDNVYLRWMLGAIVLVLVIFIFNKDIILDPLKRIGTISFKDTTTQTRILAAGVSWQGFLEHPVLGWGPENYNLIFDKYYDPRLYPAEQWFDHAHNIIFDTLSNAGALGLLSYLTMLGVAFYILFCYGKLDEKSFVMSRVFMALIIAYFLQNIFVFDALATYLPFFVLLSLVGYLSSVHMEEKDVAVSRIKVNPVSLGIVFVVIASSVYFLNVRPAMSAHYIIRGLVTPIVYSDSSIESFNKAYDLSVQGRPEISTRMVDYAQNLMRAQNVPQDKKDRFMSRVVELSKKSIEEEPKNIRYYSYFANLAFVDTSNTELILEIDELMDKAVAFAPNKPVVHLQRYQLKAILGKNVEAVAELQKAHDLYYDPRIGLILAENYRKIGDEKKSLDLYKDVFEKSSDVLDLKQRVTIAIETASMGSSENAISIVEKIMIDNPEFEHDGLILIEEIKAGKFLGGHFELE